MKDNKIYNKHDNSIMVRTDGDIIYVICNKENQQDVVVKKMTTDNCNLRFIMLMHLNQLNKKVFS